MQGQVLFGGIELEKQPVQTRENIPIDIAQIVSRLIASEIGKLETSPSPRYGVLATQLSAKDLLRQQLQLLELAQELGVKNPLTVTDRRG